MQDETTASPAAATPGGMRTQIGRYQIVRKLGEGGMGAVYLAHDPQLDRPVAIKLPRAVACDPRVLREARAAAALRHPNICPIFDMGEDCGQPYLCMAYIRGETLAAQLARLGVPPVDNAVALVRKLALAMHEAHRLNILHRDLKPANIMIDEHGEPVIMDFGLARSCTPLATQLTAAGVILGTPAYMPPEQIEGDPARIGPACDIYSLGVILYELLTGTVPFHGDFMALAMQVAADTPKAPSQRKPGLDARLDAVVLKALEKDPARRWPSMSAFADALQSPAAATAATLTLHIAGTPYAYRAEPNQNVVTVGRQRRKPDSPPDEGSDFFVRVAGNDESSLRISRRHLEFVRTPDGWSVIHRGRTPTERNGVALAPSIPTPLIPGDRLSLCGVVTLFVDFDSPGGARVSEVTLPPDENRAAQLLLDATRGDMVHLE
jgi:serine/threonine protein kinase